MMTRGETNAMRILKFLGNGRVGYAEKPRPTAGEDAVVIRVQASALCGSEKGAFLKDSYADKNFFNAGHEVVGVVHEAPSGSSFKPGMRVGACVVQGCGKCEFCLAGNETACEDKRFYSGNGHAEFFRLGINGVRPIPDEVDWPAAAVLTGDGLGVPVRCARRLGETKGKKVLVLGLGPVGLSCVLVQAFKGAEVMGADISEYRVNLAKELGAAQAIKVGSQDLKKAVMNWSEGKGADVAILAVSGNENLLRAIDLVRWQGTVFQIAEFSKATLNPSAAFIRKEITLTGSWYYTSSDWVEMLALHQAGLPFAKLVTHVYPFEKAQEAYDVFVAGESGKVVLTFGAQ